MKKFTAFCLLIALLLAGCSSKVTAPFYYCRTDFQEEAIDSLLVSEKRDITGHKYQLDFLISLYLMGPSGKDLVSPFPAGVQLVETHVSNNYLTITLTEMDDISDFQYSIACGCMALTCFEISTYDTVTILSGDRSITMDPSILTVYDSGLPIETNNGG